MELELVKPLSLSTINLRSWILDELSQHGEPLRWAITESNSCKIRIEAVLITLSS